MMMSPSFLLTIVVVPLLSAQSLTYDVDKTASLCQLRSSTHGQWYRHDVGKVTISNQTITDRGSCIDSYSNQYLFQVDRPNQHGACYICVMIWTNDHPNVLRYKETTCSKSPSLSDACRRMYGDIPMMTLFRVDAAPERCPLQVPANFTYSTPQGRCTNAISRVDSCSVPSQLQFTYEPCSELGSSYYNEEHIQCLGSWEEKSMGRRAVKFIGRLMGQESTEEYRCFLYQPTSKGGQLAMSVDSSCREMMDLQSATKRLELEQVNYPLGQCEFNAATERNDWLSLTTGRIHKFDGTQWFSYDATQNYTIATCVDRHAPLGKVHKYTVHVIDGCKQGFQCVKIYRRAEHIIEIKRGLWTTQQFEACDNDYLSETFETLIAVTSAPRPCPAADRGHYSLDGCAQENSKVVFGCKEHQLTIQTSCAADKQHSYMCYGGWMEDLTQFLVVRDEVTTHWGCFMYSRQGEQLQLTAYDHDSCKRGILFDAPHNHTLVATRRARGSCDLDSSTTALELNDTSEASHSCHTSHGIWVAIFVALTFR